MRIFLFAEIGLHLFFNLQIMIRYFLAVCLFGFSIWMSAQTAPHQYMFRVYLKDKPNAGYSVANPEKFLSGRSIERKNKQNVKVDASDFPVSADYLRMIEKSGAKIVSQSKWFNTCVAQVSDSAKIEDLKLLPFVDSVKYVWRGFINPAANYMRPRLEATDCGDEVAFDNVFGFTQLEFAVHNAAALADAGFRGKGIRVGVIDAGFTNFDAIPYFEGMAFFGYKDFVPNGYIFTASDHGTKVLSTMAVNKPNLMVGSAPEASFLLLRSEDARSEFPVEEDFWVAAVEYADSVGVDMVNTSLGYSDFDDKSLNYNHAQLDGKTSLMTRAADRAFEKGILVVGSAGNEGNKPWKKITSPGDARNILTIGAISPDSVITPFSSVGPTADHRIKPDLVSVGGPAVVIGQNGAIGLSMGTSFSAPFMAGLIASLWSINPELNRQQIINIVKQSADRYQHPDTIYGYGIPDFGKAMSVVLETLPTYDKKVTNNRFSIAPDVANKNYEVTLIEPEYTNDAYSVKLLNQQGIKVTERQFEEKKNFVSFPITDELSKTGKFIYFVIDSPFKQDVIRIKR